MRGHLYLCIENDFIQEYVRDKFQCISPVDAVVLFWILQINTLLMNFRIYAQHKRCADYVNKCDFELNGLRTLFWLKSIAEAELM